MVPCGKTSQPNNRTKIGLLSLWILNTDFLTSSRPDPFSSPFSQGARTMSCSEKILDSVYSDDLVDFWWCWNLSWCLFRLWLEDFWCKCWRKRDQKIGESQPEMQTYLTLPPSIWVAWVAFLGKGGLKMHSSLGWSRISLWWVLFYVHLVGVAGEGHRVAKLNRHAYVGRYCWWRNLSIVFTHTKAMKPGSHQ